MQREQEMEEEEKNIQNSLLRQVQIVRTVNQPENPEQDRKRCLKWFDMLEVLKNEGKTHSKLKSRARKGIPESIRGIAWPVIADTDNIIPLQY